MSAVSRLTLLAVVLLFLLLPAPAPAQNTFYAAYRRGMELEKNKNWSEAREAFLQAASLHPEPGSRVHARGLYFIRIYDPYARLARCELRLGMLEEAKRHLEVARTAAVTPQAVLDELESDIRRHASGGAPPAAEQRQSASPAGGPGSTPQAEPAGSPSTSPQGQSAAPQPSTPPASSSTTPTRAEQPAGVKPETEHEKGPRITGRTIAGIVILVGIVAAIGWALGRRTSKTQLPEGAWKQAVTHIATTQQRLTKPEDTPTRVIEDIETAKPTPTGTPVPIDFAEAKKQTMPLKAGTTTDFGAYTLEGILGRGGMGTTFLARRKRDGLPVAIKVPHDHLLDNEEFAQRFLREGSLGSTLHHPNIIRIYEAEKIGNQPYIVMELLEGESLEKKLRRERNLPVHEALEIARDIALALDYARLKGVVHRDLKPDNIMLLKRGGLKVMDYGIARIVGSPGLTASEAYLGTPTYSAPEATLGKVDQQSDLYSLGIIFYRMITGDPPFRSTDPLEVLQMHRNMPLPPFPAELNIPSEVSRLVQTLTQKNKTDRYRDAESFLIDLNRTLKQL